MERWTRAVIANRKKILAAWIVLFALGGYGASHLGELLTNRFSVPGSDAERGLDLLKEHFNERADGAFTLVFQSRRPIVVASRPAAGPPPPSRPPSAPRRPGPSPTPPPRSKAPSRVPSSTPRPHLAYAQINTPLQNQDAAKKTPAIRAATPTLPGIATYLTGFPAINHDTQRIYSEDLTQGGDDRDPDRADRDGLHVRDAGRDRRAASPSPR